MPRFIVTFLISQKLKTKTFIVYYNQTNHLKWLMNIMIKFKKLILLLFLFCIVLYFPSGSNNSIDYCMLCYFRNALECIGMRIAMGQ